MLPTQEKAKFKDLILVPTFPKKLLIFEHQNCTEVAQHLYIVSAEKIKDNDWFLSVFYSYPVQNTKEWREEQESHGKGMSDLSDLKFHKIIASTDKNLNLPQPSEAFIQKYIESYNKSEIITNVLVEYDKATYDKWFDTVKINPKDNTITILKQKDSWSKNDPELMKAFEDFACAVYDANYGNYDTTIRQRAELLSKKWIEENLD